MTNCAICSKGATVVVSVRLTSIEEPRCDEHAQFDHPQVSVEQRLSAKTSPRA